MKNSEICRAAMPFVYPPAMPFVYAPELYLGKYTGMCIAISEGVKAGNPNPVLKILFRDDHEFRNAGFHYYDYEEEGYTSRIIFLELAALLWEEFGQ